MMADIRRTPLSQGILSFTSEDPNNRSLERSNFSPLPTKDVESSPRQTTPTKARIVSKPEYMSELALSDVDTDVVRNSNAEASLRRLPHAFQEVLHTEMAGDQDFSKSGEVPTKTYKMKSPARVICHSPSSSRDEEIEDESKKREKKLRGDRMQSGKPKSLSFTGGSTHSSPPVEMKPAKNRSMDIEPKASTTTTSATSTAAVGSGSKKKKKKFIQVESRFKQTSKKPNDTLKSKSLELSAITPHPSLHSSSHTQAQQQKKSRVTSTPFLMTSMYEGQAHNDGSILDQTRFQVASEPPIKQPLTKKTSTSKIRKEKEASGMKRDTSRKKDQSKDSSKEIKGNIENEQLLIDLYHARRLQQVYLDMKARKTFDRQEEKAKNEMYALWALNRKLEKEIEALTLSVNARKMEIAIDQLLNAQLEGFKQLPGKLSKLMIKSGRLTDALANTSHYLDLNDVTIGNEEVLIASLDESKKLLADITALTRRPQPQIEELSMTNEVLVKTLENEMKEQSRCSELLGACSSLMNRELSLQAQLIQT